MANIAGKIIDEKTKKTIAGLRVETWDNENLYKKLVAKATTDNKGIFKFSLTDIKLRQLFGNRKPKLYFKIFMGTKLIKNTINKVLWDTAKHAEQVTIAVKKEEQPVSTISVALFHVITGNLTGVEAADKDYVNNKLNNSLKERIIASMGSISKDLKNAIYSLPLDYNNLKNKTLKEVINDDVLLILESATGLKKEIDSLNTAYMGGETETISEILYLDKPFSKNPVFAEDSSRARTLELSGIVNLDPAKSKKLADKGLILAELADEEWKELIKEGTLTKPKADDLKLAWELSSLTGDNFFLVRKLKTNSLKSVKELVSHDKDAWVKILRDNNIKPPQDETIEEYVESMLCNLEMTYPTEFFCHRVINRDNKAKLMLIKDIEPLFKKNKVVFNKGDIADLDWTGINNTQKIKIEKHLQELKGLANTYKHLGLEEILNDKRKNPAQKELAIKKAVNLLSVFHRNNPDLDLRTVNFFSFRNGPEPSSANYLNWTGVSDKDKPKIKKQLMAYQRAMHLGERFDLSDRLLANGFDSASSIVNLPVSDFAEKSGLSKEEADYVYKRAVDDSIYVNHGLGLVQDIIWGGFGNMNVGNNDSRNLINDLKQVDGYEDLFGIQNYCHTKHCKSIFSPAAYFVDLMHFIESNISNKLLSVSRGSNSLFLKRRRPDLWQLKLTCENTDTLIPYLEIINNVLEVYLKDHSRGASDIYDFLSDQKSSFRQPFSLPSEKLRLYLNHFNLKLADIFGLLKQSPDDVARERLNLSYAEYLAVTTEDLSGILEKYGNPTDASKIGVPEFLKSTGLTRSELDRLINVGVIKHGRPIKIVREKIDGDIQKYKEVVTQLDMSILDNIHRFVRLWRKLPWSIEELDMILWTINAANEGEPLTKKSIRNVAALLYIQEALKVSPEELCALFHFIPNRILAGNENGLLDRLFDSKSLWGEGTRIDFYHAAFDRSPGGAIRNDAKTPQLVAGLGISETEWLALLNFLQPVLEINERGIFSLDRQKLTTIYRHVKLAKALKLSLESLFALLRLLFKETPFISKIEDIKEVIDVSSWLNTTSFSPKEAEFILIGNETDEAQYQITGESVLNLIQSVQTDKSLVFKENILSSIEGISEADSKKIVREMKRKNLVVLVSEGEYLLTEKYNLDHDFNNVLRDAGIGSDLGSKTSEMREVFKEYHPVEVLPPYLCGLLNISQEFFTYLKLFIETDLSNPDLIPVFSIDVESLTEMITEYSVLTPFLKEAERLILLFKKLNFKTSQLVPVFDNLRTFFAGGSDRKFTLDSIKFLSIYKELLELGTVSEDELNELLNAYKRDRGFTQETSTVLAKLLASEQQLVMSLVESETDFSANAIETIAYLNDCLSICQILGINGFSLKELTKNIAYDEVKKAAHTIFSAFRAKYDDETEWKKIIEPFNNKLNSLKRDALCDYILSREEELKFKDRNDLYNFFLIDVDMSGEAKISKLVAGTSSLQLYIHRCLVNLEQSESNPLVKVNPAWIPQQEWEWMKNYRVWEANRKVFLYPENYIEPELRDNKTPFFKELEEELLQQDISLKTAEQAYKKYITQFAEVANLQIAGTYYQPEQENTQETLYIFGRTSMKPSQYYYRRFIEYREWTPWEKIDLGINAQEVSAVVHKGKLYLFWVEIHTEEKFKMEEGSQETSHYEHQIKLNYSYLNESGKWVPVQTLEGLSPNVKTFQKRFRDYFNRKHTNYKAYPHLYGENEDHIGLVNWLKYRDEIDHEREAVSWKRLDLFHNELKSGKLKLIGNDPVIKLYKKGNEAALCLRENREALLEAQLDSNLIVEDKNGLVTHEFSSKDYDPRLSVVNNKFGDFVLKLKDQQFLIRKLSLDEQEKKKVKGSNSAFLGNLYFLMIKREMIRLTTSLPHDLSEILYTLGIEKFLSLKTQEKREKDCGLAFRNIIALAPPLNNPRHLDFEGAYGTYYRELFFHIPFLIANHLNANQKFKEAKFWYEKIFNPASEEEPDPAHPADRNWQYIEFRNLNISKLKEILTDKNAIEQYKEDPFNPHAIARLRMNAYQKSIVMKYIDNLLDWGDHLFAQDTLESINEATMLYVMASDILGKRPVNTGECETVSEGDLTYTKIRPLLDEDSEFLIALENWTKNIPYDVFYNRAKASGTFMGKKGKAECMSYDLADSLKKSLKKKGVDNKKKPLSLNSGKGIKKSILVFGVPANETLFEYWDRVEDRLFKIRNGMNLEGVRRELALFQPPINPMMLVKAKSAGLSLEDILVSFNEALPPYRFTYLIEKAKQVVSTVQNFGPALLSALEKKDTEDLNLLRAVHENNILELTDEIKNKQIEEAKSIWDSVLEAKINMENRKTHYESLVNNGLNSWEQTQQIAQHVATSIRSLEAGFRLTGALLYLIPNGGSPFAMTYGGRQLGSWGEAAADIMRNLATISDSMAASAGLEANFKRRKQEWEFQKAQAEQEIKDITKRAAAAEIRHEIASHDLILHQNQIEQAQERYDFLKEKFTELGLYNYLSTTLTRLYRDAYQAAYQMAKMAERAYRFERDDDSFFIMPDNWQSNRAGLLSGERLLSQLQRMEYAYLENNIRENEMTQSFSLRQVNAEALIDLQESGSCEVTIPELMFDLFYPGQYKRRIKSVRLTIPCVTGPFTNVSCKLTLLESWIRKTANLDADSFVRVSEQNATSVATSNANNDGGVFELNFRDERYLPFEGAGAVSSWRLELPSVFRAFDYSSISDVIIHISYTAKDDPRFKETIESGMRTALIEHASSFGLFRLFSMKQEFSTELHRLFFPPNEEEPQKTVLRIDRKYFPFLLRNRNIFIEEAKLIIRFKEGESFSGKLHFGTAEGTVSVGMVLSSHPKIPLPTAVFSIGHALKEEQEWLLQITEGKISSENIEDIFLCLDYRIDP